METALSRMRELGWLVAIHNDYVQGGKVHAFWLFTRRADGRFVKGEGVGDTAGLIACLESAERIGQLPE